ncbi:Fic family protein [Thiobaca trueperi]|uniref:Fic family protein n=1 Tax=Thiobaca trueperi TaxID=127458 RepID=A0A4R3MUP5_9GAMM|nr:Fic family protein [Thiobaca trueperi]TCT19855.1 Fic family protein [Thiobaca trueperi]
MKIPRSPPNIESLLKSFVDADDTARLAALFRNPVGPAPGGRYLHWDELRHRQPPSELSTEEWWFAVKMARQQLYKPTPLTDKSGKPFVFALADPILALLHRIDRDASGQIRLEAPIASPATRDTYLVRSLIEEAINSSQLEGASTTRQVAKEMLRQGRRPRDKSERMIFNNFKAMRAISERIGQPLTPQTILELHSVLTRDTLDDPTAAGRLRRADEPIDIVDHRDQRVLHAPPHADELPERLERLCRFANNLEPEPFVPPIIRAILLHFGLAYDHPFIDGNGRVARALFYWSAISQGYWLLEFVSISSILKKAPAQYARAYLFTETDDSDVTYFLIQQLETIVAAMDGLHAYLRRKADETQATESMLRTSAHLRDQLNHRQLALIRHAVRHPGARYTIEGHRQSHNVVYQTARADLLRLAELGLLHQRKVARALVFEVPANLDARLSNVRGTAQK